MLNQLGAIASYSNQQQLGNHLESVAQVEKGLKEDKQGIDRDDQIFLSNSYIVYEKIAQEFDVAQMDFKGVNKLKSELYQAQLINFEEINGLTIATQSKPDSIKFNAATAIEELQQKDLYWQPKLKHLHSVFKNLESAQLAS